MEQSVKRMSEPSVSELKAIKSTLEAELGIDSGPVADAAWVARQLDTRKRYRPWSR